MLYKCTLVVVQCALPLARVPQLPVLQPLPINLGQRTPGSIPNREGFTRDRPSRRCTVRVPPTIELSCPAHCPFQRARCSSLPRHPKPSPIRFPSRPVPASVREFMCGSFTYSYHFSNDDNTLRYARRYLTALTTTHGIHWSL